MSRKTHSFAGAAVVFRVQRWTPPATDVRLGDEGGRVQLAGLPSHILHPQLRHIPARLQATLVSVFIIHMEKASPLHFEWD